MYDSVFRTEQKRLNTSLFCFHGSIKFIVFELLSHLLVMYGSCVLSFGEEQ